MSARWTGQVAFSDGSDDNVLAVVHDLMRERTAEQFTPVVEFEVLAGSGEERHPNGQKIDTRVSGVPRIFECQIVSYDRPR
jgi:hypothetical protein